MKLYNSLTNKKEEFKPIRKGEASIYSCGPTVYDHVQIGNLRAFLLPDLLQRALRHVEGYKVVWVMNITDVDDKLIIRAQEEFPKEKPEEGREKLADKFSKVFLEDIKKVGIEDCDISKMPKATDNIEGMQKLIKKLLNDDIAYISNGSIYFSLEKYKKSGKKYGRLVDLDFTKQARVTDDQDQKEGVADFALWKAQKKGEPAWDFKIDGKNYLGRPGWHIECSVMSTKYLGQPFDIHTGGVDLKFPHHENELAQCGGVQANYYLHNEFLEVSGEKMSKSKGNFITIKEIGDPMAFRYLCFLANYRTQIDYSDSALKAASERLRKLRSYVDQLVLAKADQLPEKDKSNRTSEFTEVFETAIKDDLNSAGALAAFNLIEGKIYSKETLKAIKRADLVLGLRLITEEPLTNEVKDLIENYDSARKSSLYKKSDAIRKELAKNNIAVSDTEFGTLVNRIN